MCPSPDQATRLSPAPHRRDRETLAALPIPPAEHRDHLRTHPEASFLQSPDWATLKPAWRAASIGIFRGDRLVGTALVLRRPLPAPLGHRHLAYVAEGPVLDPGVDLLDALDALADRAGIRGSFLLRVAPPGIVRRWSPGAVRAGAKDPDVRTLDDLDAATDPEALDLHERLRGRGWRPPAATDGFAAGQPLYQAHIPLDEGGLDAVLARMNQNNRRRTRRALRSDLNLAEGGSDALGLWQDLYEDTAERDGFRPRGAGYFSAMLDGLGAHGLTEVSLLTADDGEAPLAAAIALRQGERSWYLYGASSSTADRGDAPRALQARQIQDALDRGARVHDLGGVAASLDPALHLFGLTDFKTGLGADVVQTHGEWDLPLNKALTRGFQRYMLLRTRRLP